MSENENIMPAPDGEQVLNGQTPEGEKPAKQKKRRGKVLVEKWIFFACALVSIVAVAGIVVFIFISSLPAFSEIGFGNFVFGSNWNPGAYDAAKDNAGQNFGILPMIVSSLCVTLFSLLLGGLLGVFCAIFLVFWCPAKLKKPFEQIINVFAGVPSIIYGFFGMSLIVPLFSRLAGNGYGILACSLVLMLMILPTIASMSKNALQSVPESYYEGAVALGMTKAQAVFTVMLPAAKSGVVSGLIMGMGRAIGEAMAVSLVAGNSASYPHGLFSNIRTMTTNIALEMGYATGLQRDALVATGFILLIFVLILNAVIALTKRERTAEKASAGKKRKNAEKNAATAAEQKDRNVFAVMGSAVAGAACKIGRTIAGAARKTGGFISGGAKKVKAAIIGKRGFSSPETGEFPEYVRRDAEYKKKGVFSSILMVVSFVFAAFAVICLAIIVIYMLINGLPALGTLFGTSDIEYFGNALVGTLLMIVMSLIVALPLGICAAIYLHEYAKPGSFIVKTIRLFNDTLGGMPSIVFGLFGKIFFVLALGMNYSPLAGALTMALVILPTIVRSVEESLIAVPDSLREASLALGASKFQTLYKVVLPQALPGILTATVLSIGRIVGESAALIFTLGGSVNTLPAGLVGRGSQSSTLTVWVYSLLSEMRPGNEELAYAVSVILLVLVAIIYVGLGLIESFSKKEKGTKKRKDKIKPPEVTA